MRWWPRCRSTPQPVSKITIVPHTSGALGYTMQMPEEEKFLKLQATELLVELQHLAGRPRCRAGRLRALRRPAHANDIERATDLARKMVMQYGMSDRIGLMALTDDRATSISTASQLYSTAPIRRPLPPMTRSSKLLQDSF